MEYVLYAIGAVLLVVIGLLWWRYTSVVRGAKQRDEIILKRLDAVGEKLSAGVEPSSEELTSLASSPENRPLLFEVLAHFDELDLFPSQFLDRHSQAAGRLSYWLMHPNEAGVAPRTVEPLKSVCRRLDDKEGEFLILRYALPEDNPSDADSWGVGLVGPFFDDDMPYEGPHAAFARIGDVVSNTNPDELVDWYVGVIESKAR